MLIRRETARDADVIRAITTAAFAPRRPPGQTVPEARLIDELRAGPAGFRPEWQPHFQVRVLSGYQPRLRGMFTYPEPFDRT